MSMSDKGKRAAVAAIVAAGASLGIAGTATAATVPATLAVNQACYITIGKTRPTMTVTGTGYIPGDPVNISDATGTFDEDVTADASGAITATAPAPVGIFDKPGEKADAITATDYSEDGNEYVGTTQTELSFLGVTASKTKRAHGLRALTFKTKWSFSGFPEGKSIYAHYIYGKKTVARQSFGKAKGPCGLLTTHARLYPATPHHREYHLQIDSRRSYSRHASPRIVTKVGLELF
ncbi:MAG TPA: hypothetical protein VMF07_00250 [Solirubrobacteraceae bacterium]|nr:hypothetical protein [Solirubrobacteraceae bacterium]